MDQVDAVLANGFAKVLDIPGINYRTYKYLEAYETLSRGFILGSETASTVSSRGVYKFPVKVTDNSQYASWAPTYDPNAINTLENKNVVVPQTGTVKAEGNVLKVSVPAKTFAVYRF